MEKSLIQSISSSCLDWTIASTDFDKCCESSSKVANLCLHILQKINSIYSDVNSGKYTGLNAFLQKCCQRLHSVLAELDDKNTVHAAKLLTHLVVKVLQQGDTVLSLQSADLLLELVSNDCLDDNHKERQSITGYVYKALWNGAMTLKNQDELVLKLRLRSIQLALCGTCVDRPSKISQQLNVTLSDSSKVRPCEQDLMKLFQCAKKAVRRTANNEEWKSLMFYVYCILAVHDLDLNGLEKVSDLEQYYSLATSLLFKTGDKDYTRGIITQNTAQVLTGCSDIILVQALLQVISHGLSSCKSKNSSVLMQKGFLHSQMLCFKFACELAVDDAKMNAVYQSHFAHCMVKSLDFTMVAISKSQDNLSALLDADTQLLSVVEENHEKLSSGIIHSTVNHGFKVVQSINRLQSNSPDEALISSFTRFGELALRMAYKHCTEEIVMPLLKLLCEYLAKSGNYTAALDMFGALSDSNKELWLTLIPYWVRIKKKANGSGEKSISKRVLGVDVFSKLSNKDDLIWLLYTEFNEYGFRDSYSNELSSCLAALKSHAATSSHKALYILCQTEYYSTLLPHKVEMIESFLDKGLEHLVNNPSAHSKDLKAQILMWRFLNSYRDSMDMNQVTHALMTVDYDVGNAVTFHSETQALDPLTQAVELWGECGANPDQYSLYSQAKSVHCLDIIAHILHMSCRWTAVLQIYQLVSCLSQGMTIPWSMETLYLHVLSELGLTKIAKEKLESLFAREDNSHIPNDCLQYIKAVVYIQENKVQRAVELLEDLLDKGSRTTLENYYLSASAHRSLVDISINCTSVKTKKSLMYHAWHCQRDHSCILTSITQHGLRCYSTKLRYLKGILSSYITLAELNLFVGSVREAGCFLKAGHNLAHLMHLPLVVSQITVLQAKLDCFVADYDGAQSHLKQMHTILTSKISIVKHDEKVKEANRTKSKVEKSEVKSLKRKDLDRVKGTGLFGFESEEEESLLQESSGDDDDEGLDLKQPGSIDSDEEDAEYKVPKYGTDTSRDLTASPVFKRKNQTTNFTHCEIFHHPTQCSCQSCTEHVMHVAYIKMIATTCDLYNHQDNAIAAVSLFNEVIPFLEKLEERFRVIITTSVGKSVGSSSPFLTSKLQLHEAASHGYLQLGNVQQIRAHWKTIQSYSTSQYHSYLMVKLEYLHLIPDILSYYTVTQPKVTSLVEKLRVLTLENVTSSPLQPIKTLNTVSVPSSSIIKAPRKTRRAVVSKINRLAFDDSDSDTETKTETRTETLTTRKTGGRNRVQTSSVAQTPVRAVPLSASMSKSTKKMSIFCDEEPEVVSKPLTTKKSASSRRRQSDDSDDDLKLPPRRTRSSRTTNREILRDYYSPDKPSCHNLPVVFESPVPCGDLSVHMSGADSSDDIELPRGDTKPKSNKRRCAATESMRSSAPRSLTSPPPGILTSPIKDLQNLQSPDHAAINEEEIFTSLNTIHTSICNSRPYSLYRNTCQSLAVMYYHLRDMWKAAYFFCEMQSITFTHKTEICSTSKLHMRSKEKQDKSSDPLFQLCGSSGINDFKAAVNSLPEGWSMSYIHVVKTPNQPSCQQLYVTRLEKNLEPVVMLVSQMEQPAHIWQEFEAILSLSKDSMSEIEKTAWWEKRRDLDRRLKNLLIKIQCDMGVVRSLLVGNYSDYKSQQWVGKCTEKVVTKLAELSVSNCLSTIKALVNSASSLNDDELSSYFLSLSPHIDTSTAIELSSHVKDGVAVMMDTRAPIIFALDKDAHALCWESLPLLSDHAVYRMPSIYAVQSYLSMLSDNSSSVYTTGIDSKRGFYVLNPDNNLEETEGLFKPILSSKKQWKGIIGRKPAVDEYKKGLSDHDLFLFLGHGSGSKYCKGRELSQIECRSAALLMGCSSGAFDARGSMEPSGIIYDYHLAKCPSVLACLWDVTDKDIDRFTRSLLKTWLSGDREQPYLSDHIAKARQACKLPYLVGSASVIYGLPISVNSQ